MLSSISDVLFTWWGLFLLAALDSSVFFFLPFGNDTLVVYLAARSPELFWVYPLTATAGSSAGGAVTYWIGRKAGEAGLPRLVPKARLRRVRARVRRAGALAMALPAALPPPFPLTPFLLTCGALEVSPGRLLAVFAGTRLVRFGIEAVLARRYGDRVLTVLESDSFQFVVGGLIVLSVIGTTASIVAISRRRRRRP